MSTLGVDTHLKEGLGWEPVVADKFWKWIDFEKYDKSEAFYGQVWAPKANIEMVKRMTTELGGAKFDVYPIEDIQGSVDMNNWD